MVTVFVKIQPFCLNQNIFVATEDGIIDNIAVDTKDVQKTINALCEKYSVDKIKLSGSQDYLSKMALEMNTKFDLGCPVEIV